MSISPLRKSGACNVAANDRLQPRGELLASLRARGALTYDEANNDTGRGPDQLSGAGYRGTRTGAAIKIASRVRTADRVQCFAYEPRRNNIQRPLLLARLRLSGRPVYGRLVGGMAGRRHRMGAALLAISYLGLRSAEKPK